MRPACVLGAIAVAAIAPADASGRTLYVRAGAAADGKGTRKAPFNSLAAVEAASRRRDRIVVLPAPRSLPPLDGGIRLKPRQRLIGAWRTGRRQPTPSRAPRIANTTSRLDGDAVRLANGVTVRNLDIVAAARGGIYGRNVSRVRVVGNAVSGHNTSCTRGFHIPGFNVPTIVRGVGIPINRGLDNGWAGIMVDVARGRSRLRIRRNRVHDSDCGDGIDVRASGPARVRAWISRNVIRDLREGDDLDSVLAIGLQTRNTSRLAARLTENRQAALGNDEDLSPDGADSEGVFVNPVGPSRMRITVERNRYTHTPGRGGFSANGLEFVSMGKGSRARVDVRDSSFTGPPGDVLEQLALGTDATLSMKLDRVTAAGSTGHAGSGVGDTVVIPGNNADCLLSASGGAGNDIDLSVRRSTLTDCANNGITFGSAVANGKGPSGTLRLDVADSTITGNNGANLRIGNVDGLDELRAKVERTNLSDSRGLGSSSANLTVEDLGRTGRSSIDVGGGPLGSRGGNCLAGGSLAALVVGYDVHARRNWWGNPAGPGPGRAVTVRGRLFADAPLAKMPSTCGG